MIEVGKKAPAFSLPDSDGNIISLKDFLGQKVILYFYPKDMTSGCTKEACDFKDSFPDFKKIKAVILGVSKDSSKSHIKFRDKYELPFALLSDEATKVIQKYDVWKEKTMYGRKFEGIQRTTFIIDEKGMIEKIYSKVKVNGHVEQILKDIKN